MPRAPLDHRAADNEAGGRALIRRLRSDPESAYRDLLEGFTPAILRMIRRFLRDPDEVMEVYTSLCERLRAHDFRALRGFRSDDDLMPWLAVVTANVCRDLVRKRRSASIPGSVRSRLDEFEVLVFKYYHRLHLPHADIAEIITTNDGRSCTAFEVTRAIAKIDELLTVSKRWRLLAALNESGPDRSIGEREAGLTPTLADDVAGLDEALRNRERIRRLNRALSELDKQDRLLVFLRFERGMKVRRIADVMRYDNHEYVRTRLRTVVLRLRGSLGEDG